MTEKNEIITVEAATITPMSLIARAQEANASIEQMTMLFELQLRYEENEAKKAFHLAVANFKAESITILKDKKVGYTNKDGSFTGYTHATLGNIVQTVVPVMSKHGLSHSWDINQTGKDIAVTCKLTHCMGHSASVTMSAEKDDSGKKNLIQQVSSAVTYLQRYTFLSVIGLAAVDQDDDGKAAGKHEEVEIITEQQTMDLLCLIKEVGADEAKFCSYWKVEKVCFLPAAKFNNAVKMLEAKRDK